MRWMSVKQIAEELAVDVKRVCGWINSGQLRAVNVGMAAQARRPTYRVREDHLQRFLELRSTQPPPVDEAPQRRSRRMDLDVPQHA